MNFVGMDVHVRNSYLHVMDAAGQALKRGRIGNTLGELAEFLGPFESEPMKVSLESTTNSRAIHGLLLKYGKEAGIDLTAQVLDARKLRIIAESASKCDKLDAAVLAELTASNLKLPVCHMPDEEVFALREHLRGRADLVKVRTMLKNRVHSVLHRRNIMSPKGDLFARAGRAFLKEIQLDTAGRQVLGQYLTAMDQVERTIQDSNKSLKELMKAQRWCHSCALLQTMPGVGAITAMTILAELGDIDRFKSRAAVSNYAGLVPKVRDSNNKHYSGNITRRGPAHLRGVLVEAAWVSVGRVPAYAAIYDRISLKKGKPIAIVAVARRMLEDAWTMLKRNEVFRRVPGDRNPCIDDAAANAAAVAEPSVAG
jgi:transposase